MAERNEIDNQIYQMTLNASARALSANRPVEAIEVLKSLHTEYPHDPDIAINMGGALILQRKWNQAVRVLLPAARENTQNAMLWVNLAAAYLGSLETSGPKQQQRANVHYHLGLIYKEQGNLTQASALFQRALEINPKDKDAQRWLDRLSELIVAAAQASTPDAPPPADESE
jgi:tetratricopeptide (TPR) repeat protein